MQVLWKKIQLNRSRTAYSILWDKIQAVTKKEEMNNLFNYNALLIIDYDQIITQYGRVYWWGFFAPAQIY